MSKILIKAGEEKTIEGIGTLAGFNEFEKEVNLENLQDAVEGYIELVPLGEAVMVVNEEGQIHGMQINLLASRIAGKEIVGDAVLLTGESVDLLK